MEMTEEEIYRDYRLSKEKDKQIKILAEINLCSANEIKAIVENYSCKAEHWSSEHIQTLDSYIKAGISLREISKMMNRKYKSVCYAKRRYIKKEPSG